MNTCWRERDNPLRSQCTLCENDGRRQQAAEKRQLLAASQAAIEAASGLEEPIAALQHARCQLAAIRRDGAGGAALAGPVEVLPPAPSNAATHPSAADQTTAALSTETAISTSGSPAATAQPAVLAQPVVAAAQPVAAEPAILTTATPAETAIDTGGSPSGSLGGSPDAAPQPALLAQPVSATAPIAPPTSSTSPAFAAVDEPEPMNVDQLMPPAHQPLRQSERSCHPVPRLINEANGPQHKKAAIAPKVVHEARKPASDFVSSLDGHLLVLCNVVDTSAFSTEQWLKSRQVVRDKAVSSTYISFNAPELMPDNKFHASKCLWYCSDSTWTRSCQYQACQPSAVTIADVLGMQVVGSGALVFDLRGVEPDWRVGKRQGCHYDWYRLKLEAANAAAATLLFNLDDEPAYLWVALPVEASVWCLDKHGKWEQRTGYVASENVVKITVPSMGAVLFDHTVWHGGHVYTTMHMRAHFYLVQKHAVVEGLDFRNYSKGEVSLFDGEGYPVANNSNTKQMEWATARQLEEDAAVPTVSNPLLANAALRRMCVVSRSCASG